METKYKIKDHTLKVIQDGDAESPRHWDNLSKVIFIGKYQHLGDKHEFNHHEYYYESRHDFMESGAEHITKYLKGEGLDVAYITPIHMYSHSGSTISTSYEGQYADRWDSGTPGFAVLTKQAIRENWGIKNVTQKYIDRAIEILEAEIETLDKYIRGEVYGFELWNENDEEIHSCWGFYGGDIKENGILDDIHGYIDFKEEDVEELEETY